MRRSAWNISYAGHEAHKKGTAMAVSPQGLPLVRVQSNSHGAHADILLWGISCLQALHHSLHQRINTLSTPHLGAKKGRKITIEGRQCMSDT